MNKTLLLFCVVVVAVALAVFAYQRFIQTAVIQYSKKLGVAGDHSPRSRLPELPMEIVFDQGRDRIISRQDDGKIVSWDLKTGKPRLIARTTSLFAYCSTSQLLIVNDGDDVSLVDLGSNVRRPVASESYHHAAWSKDCDTFALATKDSKTIEIRRVEDPSQPATIQTVSPVRNGLAMSDDGQFVAAAEGTYIDGKGHKTNLEIFRITNAGDTTRTAAVDDPAMITGMWKMVFAPDSRSLVVGSQIKAKSGLRSFAPKGGALNWGHDGFKSYWVRGLAVSPTGTLLVSGDEKGMLRIWNLKTGEKRFEGRTSLVIQSLSFSQDGNQLAIALWDSTIGIIDVNSVVD